MILQFFQTESEIETWKNVELYNFNVEVSNLTGSASAEIKLSRER